MTRFKPRHYGQHAKRSLGYCEQYRRRRTSKFIATGRCRVQECSQRVPLRSILCKRHNELLPEGFSLGELYREKWRIYATKSEAWEAVAREITAYAEAKLEQRRRK